MTTVNTEAPYRSSADDVLHAYHDARRREDQWRIPQLLLALVTPILALIALLFSMAGNAEYANITGALTLIAGIGAALLAVEVWRQHRVAISRVNQFRTDYPADAALLLKDSL